MGVITEHTIFFPILFPSIWEKVFSDKPQKRKETALLFLTAYLHAKALPVFQRGIADSFLETALQNESYCHIPPERKWKSGNHSYWSASISLHWFVGQSHNWLVRFHRFPWIYGKYNHCWCENALSVPLTWYRKHSFHLYRIGYPGQMVDFFFFLSVTAFWKIWK